jgi:phosphate transport system substrate-binding protein
MKRNFNFYIFQFLLISLFLFNSCTSSDRGQNSRSKTGELKGNISISGAFALYPLTVKWAEDFKKLHPGVNIDISAGGAGKGMADVLSGMVDLAMFSREVSQEEVDKGAWKLAVAKDAVFATINSTNPAIKEVLEKGLTRGQFQRLYSTEVPKKWNDFTGLNSNEKINVYTRSDACGAAAMWASFFEKEQEDLKGVGVFGDPGIADAVKKDPHGVGFNNLIYVYDSKTKRIVDGLEIIPIDRNENRIIDPEEDFYASMDSAMIAIKEGKYPSPPARSLYLIAKGLPTDEVLLSFLVYILNEGQLVISQAGYVQLDELILQKEKEKLNSDKSQPH